MSSKDVNNGAWVHPTPPANTILLTHAKRRHVQRKIRFPLLTHPTIKQISTLAPYTEKTIHLVVQIFEHDDVVLAKVNPKKSYITENDGSKTVLKDLPYSTDWKMIISQRRGVGRKTIEKAVADTHPRPETTLEGTLVL